MGCLFAGALVGTGIESWLRVDIVPIGVRPEGAAGLLGPAQCLDTLC